MSALESDMMIRSVHDIKATDMGANLIKLVADGFQNFISI